MAAGDVEFEHRNEVVRAIGQTKQSANWQTLYFRQQCVGLSGQLSKLSESLDEFFEELEVLTSAPTTPQLSAGPPLPNVAGGAE